MNFEKLKVSFNHSSDQETTSATPQSPHCAPPNHCHPAAVLTSNTADECLLYLFILKYWASIVAQLVKNPPAMQETRVW